MDISALSFDLSKINLQTNVGLAVTKKVMDVAQAQNNGLLQMLNTSIPAPQSGLGQHIDLKI